MELGIYKPNTKYRFFFKPEYNKGQNIVYTATILGREGQKLLIETDYGENTIIDLDTVSECKEVRDNGNNKKNSLF